MDEDAAGAGADAVVPDICAVMSFTEVVVVALVVQLVIGRGDARERERKANRDA